MNSLKPYYRLLAYCLGGFVFILILFTTCCTVVDSGEVGIRFHKWSLNEQDYGGNGYPPHLNQLLYSRW